MTSFNPSLCMPLDIVPAGRTVVLRRVNAGKGLTARLAAMGLVPGASVHVHRNDRNGPVVLGVADSRVMLGRGMSSKVSVQEEPPDA
jgi:Fe2+ transport system protein FeoA